MPSRFSLSDSPSGQYQFLVTLLAFLALRLFIRGPGFFFESGCADTGVNPNQSGTLG